APGGARSSRGQASSYDPHSHAGALPVVSLDVFLAAVTDKVGVTDLPGSDLPRIGVDVVAGAQPLIDHEPVGTVLLVAEVTAIYELGHRQSFTCGAYSSRAGVGG